MKRLNSNVKFLTRYWKQPKSPGHNVMTVEDRIENQIQKNGPENSGKYGDLEIRVSTLNF